MKQLFLSVCVLLCFFISNAQIDTIPQTTVPAAPKKQDKYSQIDFANRANDHFLMQFSYDGWANKPDSINTKGFSRGFNAYFMFDFPFKTNPHFSVGIGIGVGTNNIYFDETTAEVAGLSPTLQFRNVSDTNNFKKYKVATTYIDVPVELRFAANPFNTNKSFKVAVGGKIGLLLNVHNKGKNLQTRNDATINNFIQKESSKRYFNGNRLMVTTRIGYGAFSVFGQYQVNNFIKEGSGPNIHPYSIGLTISGL
jgi:hypothetical protein